MINRPVLHEWNLQPEEAIALQRKLAAKVIRTDQLPGEVRLVAGVDMAINEETDIDRKSTRLNSSHGYISYAVFCLKKKNRASAITPHKPEASWLGAPRVMHC